MTIALAYGNEILVNTTTDGSQHGTSVIGLANGNALVVWTDAGPALDRIRAQLLDPVGERIGGEFQPHFAPGPDESESSAAGLEGGGFVVVRVYTFDGSKRVQAQICDDSGAPVGGQFLVNTTQTNDQDQPSVTALEGGGFVVVWRDNSQTGGDTSFSAIRAQKFDAAGNKIGGEILVNSTTPGNQNEPHVTALSGGGFVVSWTDSETFDGLNDIGGDGDFDGVRARIFDADGSAVDNDFLVNTQTASFQTGPATAQLSNGNIVTVYSDTSQMAGDSSQAGVLARIFDASGDEVVAEFLVNTTTLGDQTTPNVAALAGGMFLVVWTDRGFALAEAEIRAQLFDSSGNAVGDEFLVNTTTGNGQVAPSIAVLANGEVMITWEDYSATGGDASGSAVRSQIIRLYETIDGDANVNTINGTAGRDAIFGLGNNDMLFGEDGDDHLAGGDASDTLHGGAGADTIDGGSGSDTASYFTATAGVTVDLLSPRFNAGDAAGDHYIAIEDIEGSGFYDTLSGDDTSNFLFSHEGDDVLDGRGGSDALHGGDGDDVLDGGGDVDFMLGELGNDTLLGGDGDDSLDGGAGDDTLAAGAGGDFLYGGDGDDALCGDDGDDRLAGDGGSDTLSGGDGVDILEGGDGNDILEGGAGDDSIFGTYDGGSDDGGIDTARYASTAAGVTADLDNSNNNSGAATGDAFFSIENLEGSDFHDILRGDDLANTLAGAAGNDFLVGRDGNDTLEGGVGADALSGGAGMDTASHAGSNAAVVINLLTGSASGGHATGDTFDSIENITGSIFGDTLTGDAGANTLSGYDGGDTLDGGTGLDTASYAGSNAAVTVNLLTAAASGGHAAGDALDSIENLSGSAFADGLTGDAGDNILTGGAGGDSLDGGSGLDTASFLGGNGVTVNLAAGTAQFGHAQGDILVSIENLSGSAFFDELTGNGLANVLSGEGGNDFMNSSNGDDDLFGGVGNDTLLGGAGADDLDGGDGTDIASYANSDAAVQVNLATGINTGGHAQGDTLTDIETVTGSAFADNLTGGAGAETFNGGNGADTFVGSLGADRLNGNLDADTVDYSGSAAAVNVNLGSGVGSGAGSFAEGDLLSSVENIIGTGFADRLIGSGVANVMQGGDGVDDFNSSNGDDQVFGEAGDDLMVGGAGADAFDGGDGTDWVFYANSDGSVSASLTSNAGSGFHAAGDSFAGVENLFGSSLADTLAGDAAANTLNGFSGHDTLSGVGGDDVLLGGAGDDWLNGGPGDDVLSGYLGADTFYYGLADFGDDVVIGFEDGVDMFHLGNTGLTFADFTETAAGPGTLLTLTADPDNTILILATPPANIDAGDFV